MRPGPRSSCCPRCQRQHRRRRRRRRRRRFDPSPTAPLLGAAEAEQNSPFMENMQFRSVTLGQPREETRARLNLAWAAPRWRPSGRAATRSLPEPDARSPVVNRTRAAMRGTRRSSARRRRTRRGARGSRRPRSPARGWGTTRRREIVRIESFARAAIVVRRAAGGARRARRRACSSSFAARWRRPSDRPINRPTGRPAERASERAIERVSERASDRPKVLPRYDL